MGLQDSAGNIVIGTQQGAAQQLASAVVEDLGAMISLDADAAVESTASPIRSPVAPAADAVNRWIY